MEYSHDFSEGVDGWADDVSDISSALQDGALVVPAGNLFQYRDFTGYGFKAGDILEFSYTKIGANGLNLAALRADGSWMNIALSADAGTTNICLPLPADYTGWLALERGSQRLVTDLSVKLSTRP